MATGFGGALAPLGGSFIVGVDQAARLEYRRDFQLELLLQKGLDLLTGHLDADELVVERLHGEEVSVGDFALRDVLPDAAGVHEREIGLGEVALRVGDEVPERALPSVVRLDGYVLGGLPDVLLGDG